MEITSMLLIVFAFVAYTIAIFSERKKHQLLWWMIFFFIGGVVFDTIGTRMMIKESPKISIHGIVGYSALAIMWLHLIWALLSKFRWKKGADWFRKFSIYAWILWMIAFASGWVLGIFFSGGSH